MEVLSDRLARLIIIGVDYISKASKEELTHKSIPEKWSKKEILGHLIDSGINNLQRFTEIQFEAKPFPIRKYNQDELVKANDYQNSDLDELIGFWVSINKRVISLMKIQTENSLAFEIELEKGKISDLKFLMIDYVDHFEHHLNQIRA